MNRKIYAEDDMIILCKIEEEDKENYCRLCKEASSSPELYFDEISKSTIWYSVKHTSNKYYSIFDKSGNYCGNITLQRPASSTPEIGIDLMKSHRNKGIAVRAIRLLARRYYNENKIDHFILRALEKNTHSRHMIEKTGAIFKKKDNPYSYMISELRETALKPENADIKDDLLNEVELYEKCKSVAYVYALYPDAFL